MNTIYQVYHNEKLIPLLSDDSGIEHYYTKENKGINHLQAYLNEFVCQYWVYKYNENNHSYNDLVGFCHYNRYYNWLKNDKINEVYDNAILGFGWYNIKCALDYNDKNNNIYIKLKKYIELKYPQYLNKFLNFDWDDQSIRFECYMCKYGDLKGYIEFVLGFFKFYGLDIENCSKFDIMRNIRADNFILDFYNNDSHPWYISCVHRRIGYVIEFLCGLYWSLIGKNIIFL